MRTSFNYGPALALLAFAAFASPAEAQRATGPFSGILGAVTDPDVTHSLTVRGSLFGAWEDTLSTSGPETVDPRFLQSGGSTGASGSISHVRSTSRFNWTSSASSSARFYGTEGGARAGAFSAQTSINSSVNRRTSLSASGGWSYSPYYGFVPGFDERLSNVGAFGGGFGAASAAERNTSTSGSAGLSVRLSRRDTVNFNGSGSRYKFLDQDDAEISRWGAGAGFSHTLTRSLDFHAGYAREEARYTVDAKAPAVNDSIDVGVDYGDTLKFARRTALRFQTSTAAVKWNDSTHYRIHGTASLSRGFGRSGSASLTYTRSTDFNAGFREPLLNDQVSAGVSSQLSRRINWSAQTAYIRGGIGFDSTASHYSAYNAGTGFNMAVTRRMSIYTDYSFYRYDVPGGSTVFTSLSQFSRQGVSAGLSLWAPLISERSTRDTR